MSKYRRKEELEADISYSEELEAQVAVDSEPKEPEEASFKNGTETFGVIPNS